MEYLHSKIGKKFPFTITAFCSLQSGQTLPRIQALFEGKFLFLFSAGPALMTFLTGLSKPDGFVLTEPGIKQAQITIRAREELITAINLAVPNKILSDILSAEDIEFIKQSVHSGQFDLLSPQHVTSLLCGWIKKFDSNPTKSPKQSFRSLAESLIKRSAKKKPATSQTDESTPSDNETQTSFEDLSQSLTSVTKGKAGRIAKSNLTILYLTC
jgi:hypothetical protein